MIVSNLYYNYVFIYLCVSGERRGYAAFTLIVGHQRCVFEFLCRGLLRGVAGSPSAQWPSAQGAGAVAGSEDAARRCPLRADALRVREDDGRSSQRRHIRVPYPLLRGASCHRLSAASLM